MADRVDNGLDNPVWTALTTAHARFALARGPAIRFAPDVAPFLAVEHAMPLAAAVLDELVGDGTALVLGPRPELPAGWAVEDFGAIHQMISERPIELPAPTPDIVELGPAERPALLELVALVYPHYFRPRTPELGRYHGIFAGDGGARGRLDASIGERMAVPGATEISAVCTHPDRLGLGYARRLLAHATNAILARGDRAFLHVTPSNTRAVRLYEQNHYRHARPMPFCAIRRALTG